MLFADIGVGQKNVTIDVELISVGEIRVVNETTRVVSCVMRDQAGEDLSVSIWNNNIDKLTKGTLFRLEGVYCNEFNGQKQLTTGKFGRIRVYDEKER